MGFWHHSTMDALLPSSPLSAMSDRSASRHQSDSPGLGASPASKGELPSRLTVPQIQDIIFQHLIRSVQNLSPEEVLHEFCCLFIHCCDTTDSKPLNALYQLVFLNNQEAFQTTLKRSCYILINNWASRRNEAFIYRLIAMFEHSHEHSDSASLSLNRVRKWVADFISSNDYDELKLFIARHELDHSQASDQSQSEMTATRTRWQSDQIAETSIAPEEQHWSSRYVGQLLVAQSVDPNNPLEQREAAAVYARQWRERFKFDLAMYMAKSQSSRSDRERLKNPTNLGDQVLKIVKSIVLRTGKYSYSSLANLFLQQTEGLRYHGYKKSLLKYISLESTQDHMTKVVRRKLQDKLASLLAEDHDQVITEDLQAETCRHLIQFLTTEDLHNPSRLFLLILSNGSALTLTIFLLKLVLIAPSTRSHLDLCIARLVKYYEQFDEEKCRWAIYFFDIFNVTFAIYTENVQYNLVSIDGPEPSPSALETTPRGDRVVLEGLYDNELRRSLRSAQLDRYRLFLQMAPHAQLPSTGDLLETDPVLADSLIADGPDR
jgi:hypothetical protein